jgi:hypothetical protein
VLGYNRKRTVDSEDEDAENVEEVSEDADENDENLGDPFLTSYVVTSD